MGIKALIKGENYDTTVIRREKKENGFKNIKTKVAEVEDSETGEKMLKFKNDGTKIPKPENQQFETLWYKDFLDSLTKSQSHTDFIEIYLEEAGKNADGDFVAFNPENKSLELTGNESQFQAHRDMEAEKTLDIFSSDDNQALYFLAGLGVITMINLGGMYIIVNGLDSAIVKGVKEGFTTVQQQGGTVTGAATGFVMVGMMTESMVLNLKEKLQFWK